ncbi:hypothetical protein KM043_003177 [Ampulex compressa]|nr:hypothetical protein KM043_003177 [Ampulex compressa]
MDSIQMADSSEEREDRRSVKLFRDALREESFFLSIVQLSCSNFGQCLEEGFERQVRKTKTGEAHVRGCFCSPAVCKLHVRLALRNDDRRQPGEISAMANGGSSSA